MALILGMTLVSLASSWYQVRAEKDALRRDLERKAEILGESLAGNAESYLRNGDRSELERMVQRFGNRDHLLGVGVYDRDLSSLVVTRDLGAILSGIPPGLKDALSGNRLESKYLRLHLKRTYVLAAPLHSVDRSIVGGIVLVYDTAYIRSEIFRVWSRVFVHIAGQVLVIVAITLLIVRWSLTGPVARIEGIYGEAAQQAHHGRGQPLGAEFLELVDLSDRLRVPQALPVDLQETQRGQAQRDRHGVRVNDMQPELVVGRLRPVVARHVEVAVA